MTTETTEWITHRIGQLMAAVRSIHPDGTHSDQAVATFSALSDDATRAYFPNRNAVLAVLDEAREAFQSGDSSRTVQLLSRALLVAERSEGR